MSSSYYCKNVSMEIYTAIFNFIIIIFGFCADAEDFAAGVFGPRNFEASFSLKSVKYCYLGTHLLFNIKHSVIYKSNLFSNEFSLMLKSL